MSSLYSLGKHWQVIDVVPGLYGSNYYDIRLDICSHINFLHPKAKKQTFSLVLPSGLDFE